MVKRSVIKRPVKILFDKKVPGVCQYSNVRVLSINKLLSKHETPCRAELRETYFLPHNKNRLCRSILFIYTTIYPIHTTNYT